MSNPCPESPFNDLESRELPPFPMAQHLVPKTGNHEEHRSP